MACTKPCSACDRKGLPILFTRYAAAYSAEPDHMAALAGLRPTGQFQAAPDGIALKTAVYQVRMLRAGFVYLLIERDGLKPEWSGYAVHPHGYLSEFPVSQPQSAQANVACNLPLSAANASMVWVQDAKRVRKLQYFFHPDPVDFDHLRQEIEVHPQYYMKRFDVEGWAAGNTGQSDTATAAQLDTQVVEFAALSSEVLQGAINEQHFGLMGNTPTERAWGQAQEQRIGRHFLDTPGGAAIALAKGPHTVTVTHPPYAEKHGPRLQKMARFLAQHQGAVVACDDPIGIAQEISLHLLTAAIPYTRWLAQVDEQGVSNKWKLTASVSVQTVDRALAKRAIAVYDDQTESLEREGEALGQPYPGSDSKQPITWRRPDGSIETITVAELNRRRQAEVAARVEARKASRERAVDDAANAGARKNIETYCDMPALAAFDRLHEAELAKRDVLMDLITDDLLCWVRSDALNHSALARYNPKTGIDSGDGQRCATQIATMLLQLDSSPKGRKWYGELDALRPSQKNLIWQMLSLNNTEISDELREALEMVQGPVAPAGYAQSLEEKANDQKAYSLISFALGNLSKTLSASDKILKEIPKAIDSKATAFARVQSGLTVALALKDAPLAILTSAIIARFNKLPLSKAENYVAKGQLILMAKGLGARSIAFAKNQTVESLSGTSWKAARATQRQIEKAIRSQLPDEAVKGSRVSNVVIGLNTIAIVPALATALRKRDLRSASELMGALAGLIGSLKQWRADIYQKVLLEQVPELFENTRKLAVLPKSKETLKALKVGAAKYVVAGASVLVVLDVLDGWRAKKQEEYLLMSAYGGRVVTGTLGILGVIGETFSIDFFRWITRINIWILLTTVSLSTAIDVLKGNAWVNWLQSQPFGKATSKKVLFESEDEMSRELVDVLLNLT